MYAVNINKPEHNTSNTLPIIEVQSDNILYSKLPNLEKASHIIALVEAVNDFKDSNHIIKKYPDGTIADAYTESKVKIKKIYKGAEYLRGNKEISIIEPNSVVNNDGKDYLLKFEGYDNLIKNKEYIVFLQANNQGGYGIINLNNGKIAYHQDKLSSASINDEGNSLQNEILSKYK